MDKERQVGRKSLSWYLHILNYSNKSQVHEGMFSLSKRLFKEKTEPHRNLDDKIFQMAYDHKGKDIWGGGGGDHDSSY